MLPSLPASLTTGVMGQRGCIAHLDVVTPLLLCRVFLATEGAAWMEEPDTSNPGQVCSKMLA
jgi:hypothetical protein